MNPPEGAAPQDEASQESGPTRAAPAQVPPIPAAPTLAAATPAASGGAVLTRTVTICNRRGLHARAAARFVTMAERFGASVEVVRDGQTVSARSIMGLMMLGAGKGAEVELRAEGWDAKEALDALTTLIETAFDEPE